MSNQPILCEVSEVIFRVSNRRASLKLRRNGVANVVRCNCVSDVCTSAIVVAIQAFSRSGFVFKSLCIWDLQRPIRIIPSFAANLANLGRNLANWSLNLAIPEANLASETSFSLEIMAICEVSEVISLPSHVRTRTCARAGETVFQYRSGRKITSHNLLTSQLGSTVGGRLVTDASSTSDQRTTLHHVARFLPSRPPRCLSYSSRQWANSGPQRVCHYGTREPQTMGPPPKTTAFLGRGNSRAIRHSLFVLSDPQLPSQRIAL
jgi:hypothetical protein